MENKKLYRKSINKLVGIRETGEIVYIGEHHCSGVSINEFDYYTSEAVDDRNDPEVIKANYSYLWKEAVVDDITELGLDDWVEELIAKSTTYGDSYFVNQDKSYIECITCEDQKKLEEYYDVSIETFECVGSGTGKLKDIEFNKIFNQEILDEALKHESLIEKHTASKTILKLIKG